MQDDSDLSTLPGRDLTLVTTEQDHAADTRTGTRRARIGASAQAAVVAGRAADSFHRMQTLFLTSMLVVLTGFVAVAIVFGMSVSGDVRAMNARMDADLEARATAQAGLDSRLDRFMQRTAGSGKSSSGQIAPVYALPVLRPRA